MRFFSTSPEVQQRLAVLVPLVALALSLFIVYPAWGNYEQLVQERDRRRAELDTLRNTPLPRRSPILLTAPDEPREAPEFLAMVRALVRFSGAELKSLQVVESGAGQEATGPVRPVRARVQIVGSYPQIRSFLYRVGRAPRLMVVASLELKSEAGTSERAGYVRVPILASIEIERYVVPPAARE